MGDQGSRPLIIMLHHYHVELLLNGVDMILQELNNRFNEKKFNFLGSIACFSPPDSFHAFGLDKLVMLSNFYPYDFSNSALVELEHQFKIHISDMWDEEHFGNLKRFGHLSQMLVKAKKWSVSPCLFAF